MKSYADRQTNPKLKIGDNVLVEQPKQNKLSKPFDFKPHQITNRKRSMVIARRKDKSVTLNSSFLKPIREQVSILSSSNKNDDAFNTSSPHEPVLRRSERGQIPLTYLKDSVCK